MATRSAVNVSLTPQLLDFVHAEIESGEYLSVSEVVREGLRLLVDAKTRRRVVIEEARRQVVAGVAQAERGELVDGSKVFAAWGRRDAAARRVRRQPRRRTA